MKKLSFIIAMMLMLVACSNDTSSEKPSDTEASTSKENELSYEEKQKEIVAFINEDMNEIAGYETKANEALATVSGENFKNDQELLSVLTSEVIPEYEKAIETAESLEVTVEELEPIKGQMEEALSIYYDALLLEKEALEKTDQELIEQSNAKGEEYLTALNEYHEEMEKLAKEYDIDYQRTQ
ncbi:hypothetical protein [Metabacillus schmidteae]|uniref:hypothetical protein n=1 Tax=Metabacillus schmidteae TaxID=2730405 RepID=UPI00158A5CE4|nr:hypothetical protein [Metabacillus schmidteae]